MQTPQAHLLPDGRLHLHHGPIDLIAEAFGPGKKPAYNRVFRRFGTILGDLTRELPALRRDIRHCPMIADPVGRNMAHVASLYAPEFVTPMAAVAGAVADAMLTALVAGEGIEKAYVNNGGDVALYLTPGERFVAAVVAEQSGAFQVSAESIVRGVATSGWRGRSHSLGIADAVTVLAATAAEADVAATMIANRVDLPGHPAIGRAPAVALSPDSDLGDLLVTVEVGALDAAETDAALDAGAVYADTLFDRGLIVAAALQLNGALRIVGETNHRQSLRS